MEDTIMDFGKDHWVELFKDIGLDEATMRRWHALFEERHGTAHQSFLEWLKVPQPDIERIRESSRGTWK
jgi:hypothetical protein